jgi:uncharacterized membrane protein HdeD (DUF308 family)
MEVTMTTIRQELRRLWHTLVWRGGAMLLLGVGALVWPEDVLIVAMVSVGIIAALFGLYEITVAASVRRRTPAWTLILLHGTTVLLFGAMTVGAPGLSLRVALSLTAGWLLMYAALAVTLTILIWQVRAVRWSLIIWAGLDIALALVAVVFPEATIFALLYFGAAYAAAFGAWQVGAGLWLRYALRNPRAYSNLGAFAPVSP